MRRLILASRVHHAKERGGSSQEKRGGSPYPPRSNGSPGTRAAGTETRRASSIFRARISTLALALAALALAGCYGQVQRTLTIDSEPQGARCWLNDNEVGRTPVTVPFTWYGTYRVRLEHPGYEPLIAEADVDAPTFQWIGPDLLYETVVPGVHRDTHAFRFALHEAKPVEPEALRRRAESLRRDAGVPAFAPIMRPAPMPEAAPGAAPPGPPPSPEEAPAEKPPAEPPSP